MITLDGKIKSLIELCQHEAQNGFIFKRVTRK